MQELHQSTSWMILNRVKAFGCQTTAAFDAGIKIKSRMTTTNIYKYGWDQYYKKNTLTWKTNISVNKLILLFLKEQSIDQGPASNCYLHDLSKRCAMIIAFCESEKNPCQCFSKEQSVALIRARLECFSSNSAIQIKLGLIEFNKNSFSSLDLHVQITFVYSQSRLPQKYYYQDKTGICRSFTQFLPDTPGNTHYSYALSLPRTVSTCF